MGNEESTMVDESTPPRSLESRNIEGLAKYISQKNVRRIVVMVCWILNFFIFYFYFLNMIFLVVLGLVKDMGRG